MMACPMCKRPVNVPSLSEVISTLGLTGHEVDVLNAVWSGRGLPVMAGQAFDLMYADDVNGGPTQTKMYSAFKSALCRLRKRLEGSGVSIEEVGYRKGLRMVIEVKR